jgi:Ca2+-binding RTX toxin-like protein
MQTYAGNVLRYATRLEKMNDLRLGDAADLFATSDSGQDVFGGGGDDNLTVAGKRAMAHGGDGDDVITLSAHADLAWGGAGNDTVFGGHADDQLWGGADADKLKGSQGEDFLVGGSGTDLLIGGEGADSLFGGDGDDTLRAGLGTDYHDGGLGADRFIFTSDGVGIGPPGGPVAGIGAAADYVAHFDIAGGDVIDLNAFGPINNSGATYTGFFPEFIIEDNLNGPDRVLIDLDRDGTTDFEIHVEDADSALTSADLDWTPYPT